MSGFATQTAPKMGDLENRIAALEAAVLTLTSGVFVSVTPVTGGVVFDGQPSVVVESAVAAAAASDMTSNSALNVTSISLPPGKWAVDGNVIHRKKIANNPTVAFISGGAHTASATLPDTRYVATTIINSTLPDVPAHALAAQIFDFSAATGSTIVYLVASASFTGGTLQAFGFLRGRRIP